MLSFESTSRVVLAVNAEPLSVLSVSVPRGIACSAMALSITAIASSARQRTVISQPTISRVQSL